MSAVSIQDLGWKYSGRKHFAIEHVNLEIPENSFVSVVGPNEHGKTTLVSCIKGLIPNSFHGVWRGKVEIFGKDVRQMSAQRLASEIGFVFADPEAQFTSMTVEEELVFGLENIGLPLNEIQDRLNWVCDLTMIGNLLDKSPYEISGGQKQRVAIASVLSMRPQIIILDEPTSMLDPLGKDNIFQILTNIKRETDLMVIVVEHNIEQVAPLSDLMVLMYDGNIAKAAPPSEFFENSDFLLEHGIIPPQSTAFVDQLKKANLYSGSLPVALEDAIAISKGLLDTPAQKNGKDAG
jgi:energy-coupling factor transport system ATP-binding protein